MRKTMIHYFTTGILFCSTLAAVAQEQPSISKTADIRFRREEYAQAAGLYERLLRTREGRKHAAEIKERLATSYRLYNQYEKAAYWYAQLLQDNTATPEDRLHYGDMLKSLGRYDEARQQYSQYPDQQRVASRIAGCDSAARWQGLPGAVNLKNETGVNTGKNDWGATWHGNHVVLVSDSVRRNVWYIKGTRRRYGRNNAGYGKLYEAEAGQSGIGYVKDFSSVINNYPYHVGPVCFTPGGDTAYVTVTDPARRIPYDKKERPVYGTRHLKLLVFVRQNDQWQAPVPFPYNSNDYSIGHAALNEGGNILYVASDMPGGSGGTDIWYCEKQADNSWGKPQNGGPELNTADDEAFPVTGAGDRLYYASKGKAGLGGYDVFAASGNRAAWTTPVNLLPPFNSSTDDFCYVPQTSREGFISSNRPGGRGGDDIYSFNLPPALPELQPLPVPLLRIPFTVDICARTATCVYLYNKTRGWDGVT
ncbi:tetratricopeptide repeat protein [Chitinophaga oryzae]|uniref:Tetratricopeptide repeat protein n=1 Tax=Chitinophaga oryzae TaxID=2725414 RepID=A0ABX6LL75_9BACT|nr:tetratricopeptide repeat protein [Chitinophaga oryzae]QJB40489.1 tetratricopeptide repeat protein [Chitinophaga oryzae]